MTLTNQSLEEIQIILVDDGSTDNSNKIMENYAVKYPKKIILLRKNNGGLSDARNFGMKYAKGEYIGFVDGDDYVENDMYKNMYAMAKKIDADLVECDFYWEYPNRLKKDIGKIYDKRDSLIKMRVVVWNKIIRRELIMKNNLIFPFGLQYEDVEFSYKMMPYIKNIGFVKKFYYHYIQRNDSILHTQNERTRDIFIVLLNILEYYRGNNLYDDYKEQLEYICIRYLLGSSFLRIIKINDKKSRENILTENWHKLNELFPAWKQNKILNNSKLMKDKYFKTVNKYTYSMYSKFFSLAKCR
jgi:glycosyltransferase involved in cell wall biosynthesis